MAANLYVGQADPRAVVDLVRAPPGRRPRARGAAARGGRPPGPRRVAALAALPPLRARAPAARAPPASSRAGRHALARGELAGPPGPAARADRRRRRALPIDCRSSIRRRRSTRTGAGSGTTMLGELTRPSDGDRPAMLAGDFNATLDHDALRRLLRRRRLRGRRRCRRRGLRHDLAGRPATSRRRSRSTTCSSTRACASRRQRPHRRALRPPRGDRDARPAARGVWPLPARGRTRAPGRG